MITIAHYYNITHIALSMHSLATLHDYDHVYHIISMYCT